MHNSYFLLKQLGPELHNHFVGCTVADCFSQNKNELVIRFVNDSQERILIAHLDPQFTCLSFPTEYNKARKNTATIFTKVINKKVVGIEGFLNERALLIRLEDENALLLKLFGQQSNVIHLENEIVVELFRAGLKRDYETTLSNLSRPLDQSEEAVICDLGDLKKVYPTLDRKTRSVLLNKIEGLEDKKAYAVVSKFINSLENPATFKILEDGIKLKLTLLDTSEFIESYKSPSKALTKFYRLYLQQSGLLKSKTELLRGFRQQAAKAEAYIKKTEVKLEGLQNNLGYKETADIIMANLYLIPTQSSTVNLLNFYTNKRVSIKLNPRLNPQQNAEKYYNKSKKFSIEINNLKESIESKKLLLENLKSTIQEIENSTNNGELKKFFKVKKQNLQPENLPYKKFNIDGFTILVGKNARMNDKLTLKIAKKDDLFFHAKDVAGSHVILKNISGKSISKTTLEKTAALAAYYSKRKTDSLCPVGYTQKKYVRKPKGSAPGLVIVEREKVLLVKPESPH